jgi:Phosphoesterase family
MAKLIWSAMQAGLWICVGFLNDAIGQQTPIQHVVFIVKENRSFDHMFGRFPGANGATHGKISTGQILPLARAPDAALNYGHGWVAAHNAMDCVSGICKMDGWDKVGLRRNNNSTICVFGTVLSGRHSKLLEVCANIQVG